MVVYALIWIKLPTALPLLAKNSPSSSRLWLHSNYTADWNEPVWGREREGGKRSHAHAPPRLHSCPWDPEIARVFEPKADMTYFSPHCTKLFANSLISFRNAICDRQTAHRAQVPAGWLNTLNIFKQIFKPTGFFHCWHAHKKLMFFCLHSLLGPAWIPTWEDIKQEVFNYLLNKEL